MVLNNPRKTRLSKRFLSINNQKIVFSKYIIITYICVVLSSENGEQRPRRMTFLLYPVLKFSSQPSAPSACPTHQALPRFVKSAANTDFVNDSVLSPYMCFIRNLWITSRRLSLKHIPTYMDTKHINHTPRCLFRPSRQTIYNPRCRSNYDVSSGRTLFGWHDLGWLEQWRLITCFIKFEIRSNFTFIVCAINPKDENQRLQNKCEQFFPFFFG